MRGTDMKMGALQKTAACPCVHGRQRGEVQGRQRAGEGYWSGVRAAPQASRVTLGADLLGFWAKGRSVETARA